MAGLAITGYKYSLSISTNNGSNYGGYGGYTLSSWTSGTSFVIPSLTNGYLYKIKIRAVNSLGDGAESEETAAFKPNTVPGAPTSVVGASGTNGQSSVSWVAPSDDGGTAVSYYTVQYSTNGSSWTTFGTTSVSSPLIVTGLNVGNTGQSYYFRVAATNAGTNGGAGAYSAASAVATPYTVPGVPASVSLAINGAGSMAVTYTAPSSNGGSPVSSYQYSTNGGSSWTTAASNPFTLSGYGNAAAVSVSVRALNSAGAGSATAGSGTTADVPAVTSMGTITDGCTTYTFPWTAGADNGLAITNYRWQYSTDGGSTWSSPPTETASATASIPSSAGTLRTDFHATSSYKVRSAAYNAAGWGGYSSASTATTAWANTRTAVNQIHSTTSQACAVVNCGTCGTQLQDQDALKYADLTTYAYTRAGCTTSTSTSSVWENIDANFGAYGACYNVGSCNEVALVKVTTAGTYNGFYYDVINHTSGTTYMYRPPGSGCGDGCDIPMWNITRCVSHNTYTVTDLGCQRISSIKC